MAIMSNYCCAYPASLLRAYPGWSEKVPPLRASLDDSADATVSEATDGSDRESLEYYYVHDNYVVTAGVWVDEQIAFDDVTEAWKRFCIDGLEFAPDAEARADS